MKWTQHMSETKADHFLADLELKFKAQQKVAHKAGPDGSSILAKKTVAEKEALD